MHIVVKGISNLLSAL